MMSLSLDFSDPAQLNQLEARDSHNDFPGWDVPSISNGSLSMQQTLIDTGMQIGDTFSLSIDFRFSNGGNVRHFIQLGIVSEYSTYMDSGGTIHEGGPGQLFGPGTEYSIMIMDNVSGGYSQIRELKSWSADTVIASNSALFVPDHNYRAILTGERLGSDSPHTLNFTLFELENGNTLFNTIRTDYLAAHGRLAFSGLTNPVFIDQMTAMSSIPEPNAYTLILGILSLLLIFRRSAYLTSRQTNRSKKSG